MSKFIKLKVRNQNGLLNDSEYFECIVNTANIVFIDPQTRLMTLNAITRDRYGAVNVSYILSHESYDLLLSTIDCSNL